MVRPWYLGLPNLALKSESAYFLVLIGRTAFLFHFYRWDEKCVFLRCIHSVFLLLSTLLFPKPHILWKMSSVDSTLRSENFAFHKLANINKESAGIQELIDTLALQEHIEGGYFVETDRDERRVANPFLNSSIEADGTQDTTRAASTSIFYFISPKTPIGHFHRNKGRTVHTLHQGRARYVLVHPPEGVDGYREGKSNGDWRIETFVVGRNVAKGERLQWIVGGGIWKASVLLGSGEGAICEGREKKCDDVDCTRCGGCLISEVCSSFKSSL
jgi:predicted cupin superfamily sugar epimerase